MNSDQKKDIDQRLAQAVKQADADFEQLKANRKRCEPCAGDGYFDYEHLGHADCKDCAGTGYQDKQRSLDRALWAKGFQVAIYKEQIELVPIDFIGSPGFKWMLREGWRLAMSDQPNLNRRVYPESAFSEVAFPIIRKQQQYVHPQDRLFGEIPMTSPSAGAQFQSPLAKYAKVCMCICDPCACVTVADGSESHHDDVVDGIEFMLKHPKAEEDES